MAWLSSARRDQLPVFTGFANDINDKIKVNVLSDRDPASHFSL